MHSWSGLLADLPRKNCWTIAEHAGNPSPDGMQHLLGRAVWDHDGVRADALLRRVPARAWQWVSAGRGAKGHRLYDRAFIRLDHGDPSPDGQAGQRWLLLRRNHTTGELAFYYCWTPRPVALATLVRVAGRRWTIEERFQTGKGLCGLDQHQVRRWRSWYRWATLAMVAHAVLVVAAGTERARDPLPSGVIGLTCNEVQHLFARLLARPAGDSGIGWPGRSGDADIKPAPAPATTNDKPPDHEAHDHGWSTRLGR